MSHRRVDISVDIYTSVHIAIDFGFVRFLDRLEFLRLHADVEATCDRNRESFRHNLVWYVTFPITRVHATIDRSDW